MLPKIACDILFSLIKAKIAMDFMVSDFHPVILKTVSMRKMQHLVAYETAIIWKNKIVLAIEYVNYRILPQLQKVILAEAWRINTKYPGSLRFALTCLDKVVSKKLEGGASIFIAH